MPPASLTSAAIAKDTARRVRETLAWLKRRGTRRNREGMARYGIVVDNHRVFGVSMARMRPLVRRLGRSHDLALALWDTGWHEARVLAALVDEPSRVTRSQMDRWAPRPCVVACSVVHLPRRDESPRAAALKDDGAALHKAPHIHTEHRRLRAVQEVLGVSTLRRRICRRERAGGPIEFRRDESRRRDPGQ
jgi:DNA alkylation repair enzyme